MNHNTLLEADTKKEILDFLTSDAAKNIKMGFEAEVIATDFDDESEKERTGYDGLPNSVREIEKFFRESTTKERLTKIVTQIGYDFVSYIEKKEDAYADDEEESNWKEIAERMAEEHNDGEEDEDEHLSPEDFEDEAREEARDDAYSEFDRDSIELEEYLENEVGVSDWSELCDHYNLEWPNDSYERNGGDYDDTGYSHFRAELFAEYLGSITEKRVYVGRVVGTGTTHYNITSDGSLNPKNVSEEAGMEIISSPMPLDEAISEMLNLFEGISDNGLAYTSKNANTGLHINLSIQSGRPIDYVKLVLFSGDEDVLKRFGRVGGYNSKALNDIVHSLKLNPNFYDKIPEVLNNLRKGMTHQALAEMIRSNNRRAVTVNFGNYDKESGTGRVEFRVIGNNYLDSDLQDEIVLAVARFARAMWIASEPEVMKKEYAKKLYALLDQLSEDDPLSMKARFTFSQILTMTDETQRRRAIEQFKSLAKEFYKPSPLPDKKNDKGAGVANTAMNIKDLQDTINGLSGVLRYKKNVYGQTFPVVEQYLEALKTKNTQKIVHAFLDVIEHSNDSEVKSTVLAFTPYYILQDSGVATKDGPNVNAKRALEYTDSGHVQVGVPWFFIQKPRNRAMWLSNILKNYGD